MAMFFGTISPSSTCSVTTIASATANDTVCSRAGETPPTESNGRRSRSATAGSPSRPSRIDDTVIPSWAPANISGSCSPARIAVTALDLPCSANASSRSRRAEISENSAPTKNALVATSRMVANTPSKSPINEPFPRRNHRGPPAGSARAGRCGGRPSGSPWPATKPRHPICRRGHIRSAAPCPR